MTNNQDEMDQLLEKLEILLKKQDDFSKEINILRIDIYKLKNKESGQTTQKEEIKTNQPVPYTDLESKKEKITSREHFQETPTKTEPPKQNIKQILLKKNQMI